MISCEVADQGGDELREPRLPGSGSELENRTGRKLRNIGQALAGAGVLPA